MEVTFEELQQAFIEERITLSQFVEVLIDNFGFEKTQQILAHNLSLIKE